MNKKPYEEIQSLTLADTIKSVESGDEKMIKPEVISNTPMESLEEACSYFKQVLQEEHRPKT